MLGLLLAAALAIEIPLLGAPLAPDVVQELNLLPGVDHIELEDDLLRLTVAPGRAVRYADLLRTIRNHWKATEEEARAESSRSRQRAHLLGTGNASVRRSHPMSGASRRNAPILLSRRGVSGL